jgi:hypothetical protein
MDMYYETSQKRKEEQTKWDRGGIIHATSNLLKLVMRFIQAIIMVVSYLHFHYVHCISAEC